MFLPFPAVTAYVFALLNLWDFLFALLIVFFFFNLGPHYKRFHLGPKAYQFIFYCLSLKLCFEVRVCFLKIRIWNTVRSHCFFSGNTDGETKVWQRDLYNYVLKNKAKLGLHCCMNIWKSMEHSTCISSWMLACCQSSLPCVILQLWATWIRRLAFLIQSSGFCHHINTCLQN